MLSAHGGHRVLAASHFMHHWHSSTAARGRHVSRVLLSGRMMLLCHEWRRNAALTRSIAVSAHVCALRNRSEFAITDTELKLMAAAAMIGDSKSPKNGYSTPAAIGTPAAL